MEARDEILGFRSQLKYDHRSHFNRDLAALALKQPRLKSQISTPNASSASSASTSSCPASSPRWSPKNSPSSEPGGERLCYVAATRARDILDFPGFDPTRSFP